MTAALRRIAMLILVCSLLAWASMLLPGSIRFLLVYLYAWEGLALLSALLLVDALATPGIRRLGYAGAAGWSNPVFLLVMAFSVNLVGFLVIGLRSA